MNDIAWLPVSMGQSPRPEIAHFLRIVADDTRLAILRLLALGDLRAGELGEALQLPSNALSYHLRLLRGLGILRDRRSSADARDVYYSVDAARLAALYRAAGSALHPSLARASGGDRVDTGSGTVQEVWTEGAREPRPAFEQPLRVLFLCTHNSARSQLAEAILRQMGGDRVEVFSAGSFPTELHPDTIAVLDELGVDRTGLHAKPLEQFLGQRFDYLITVCDRVRDACPIFPNDPAQIHWSFPDPAVVEDPEQRRRTFRQVAQELRTRIGYLLLLPHPATGRRIRPPLHGVAEEGTEGA